MLTFALQNLQIYISQRHDGSFRRHRAIEEFLADQQLLKKNSQLIHIQLQNKDRVIVLDETHIFNDKKKKLIKADAVISNLAKADFQRGEKEAKQTLISMVLGDCFPLIFFDQKSKNIAMIHAGWEPLYLNILDQVWQRMMDLWQTSPQQIWAFLGPGIRAESYRTVHRPRQFQEPHWQKYIKYQNNTVKKSAIRLGEQATYWQIDLPSFIKDFVTTHHLPKSQFLDCQLDTYTLGDEFFSYRRSQELLAKGEQKAARLNNGRFFVTCQLSK